MRISPGRHAKGRSALARGRIPGLLLLLLAGALPDGRALGASCVPAAPPAVQVDASSEEVREASDTTAAEIRRAAASRGLQPHWPGLAAYVADIKEDALPGRGAYCAAAVSVHVVIVLKKRIIHLARELQDDPCLDQAARQHAWQHARADEEAFEQLPALTGQLREALARLPPARGATEAAARVSATAAVRAQVDVFLDRLDDTRASLDHAIDAPAALDRLRAQCGPGRATRTHEPSPKQAG